MTDDHGDDKYRPGDVFEMSGPTLPTIREDSFGVDIHLGDRCFVLFRDSEPRKGRVINISGDGSLARVALDGSDETVDVAPYRITLSFQLLWENEQRRGVKHRDD